MSRSSAWGRRAFLVGAGAAIGDAAFAQSSGGFAELQTPGRHLIMRHALAPGTGDPSRFKVDDCATQRNLDDRGRSQARRTGEKLQQLGVSVDRVLSSQWCRCLDTARLLKLGEVEEAPPLNSFFQARSQATAQTEATRALLLSLRPTETAMLVTHQVNITALLGVYPTSGEVFAFEIGGEGDVRVVESLVVPA